MSHRSSDEPVYMIGIAAQLTGLHPQTVRLYERLGLVCPMRINRKNRLYSESDIARLLQIRRFTQEMGVNLAGVEVILDLLAKIDQMQMEVDDLRSRLARRPPLMIEEGPAQAALPPLAARRRRNPLDNRSNR